MMEKSWLQPGHVIYILILLLHLCDVCGFVANRPGCRYRKTIIEDYIACGDNSLDILNTDTSVHKVNGVVCREVLNNLPVVATVTVLEATAEAQELLVDEALLLDEGEQTAAETTIKRGDPYGAVLWPAAWAVSNYLLNEPKILSKLSSLSVFEIGTGTGLVSIALAKAGALRVMATDYEPLALSLTNYAATHLNSKQGGRLEIETQLFDLCDLGTPLPAGFDLLVAADILYEPKSGIGMAHRVVEALQNDYRVVIGDSPGRAGRPAFLKTLKSLRVAGEFEERVGRTCSGPRHELICGKGSISVSAIPKEVSVSILYLEPNGRKCSGKSI